MHKEVPYIFFASLLIASLFFTHARVKAGPYQPLKIESNDPIKILMACVQEIQNALERVLGVLPKEGIAGIISQTIAFFETQIQLRKSFFWIEFEKEKAELWVDAIRLLSELGINL